MLLRVLLTGCLPVVCLPGESETIYFTNSAQALDLAVHFSDLGDVDGDGDVDALVSDTTSSTLLLNNGSGHLFKGEPWSHAAVRALKLGDLDGDGDLDVFLATDGPNRIWFNDGSGHFSDSLQNLGHANSRCLEMLDVDADGDLDVVVGNDRMPDRVWINDGFGTFQDSGQDLAAYSSRWIEAGDLDADGDMDLLIAARQDGCEAWMNQGGGRFVWNGQVLPSAEKVALGDLNGDGDLDAWLSRKYRGLPDDRILWNDGSGQFLDTGVSYEHTAACMEDVDGDSNQDLWIHSTGFIGLLRNLGQGQWRRDTWEIPTDSTLQCQFADLNGDGLLDVWSAGPKGADIWFQGVTPHILHYEILDSHSLRIHYVGSLYHAASMEGPFLPVSGAHSPVDFEAKDPHHFFLVR